MTEGIVARIALLVLLVHLVGCASIAVPPRLSILEAERLKELPLPYTVGVAPYERLAYSENLTQALVDSRVFTTVAALNSFSEPPDLIATVEDAIGGTAAIPVAFLLSAGILPSSVDESHGYVFSLAPSSNPANKTHVDAHYSGTTTIGLLGSPLAALPRYSATNPERTKRFREMLAYRTLVALRPLAQAGSETEKFDDNESITITSRHEAELHLTQ